MLKTKHVNSTSKVYAERALYKFGFLALCFTVVCTSFFSYRALHYQRTVIIPPSIKSNIEVIDNQANDAYLLEMSRWVGILAFTYSPSNARSQFDDLLTLYAPEEFPAAEDFWYKLASTIETTGLTSAFYLDTVNLNEKTNVVMISGTRTLIKDNKVLETGRKEYQVAFRIQGGRFMVTRIDERG